MSQDASKIVWFEGMTLDPHHFQQWDRYRDGVLSTRLQAVAPHEWGLLHCQIDEERLANGELSLSACTAVMPDGLVVDVPGASPAPAPRPVQDHLSSTDDRVRVDLAVPADRPNGRNVRLQGSDWERPPRFIAESRLTTDENTASEERPVEIAHANVQLRFGTESQRGYSTLPIAELRRSAGGIVLSDEFVPPCLYVEASDRLTALIRELLEAVVGRSTDLATYRDETADRRELSPSDVQSLNQLGVLREFIPRLKRHQAQGRTHPEDLFETLSALAGHLTAYVDPVPVRPRDLPTYDHSAPTDPFRQLASVLHRMLGKSTPSAGYETIDLQRTRDHLLRGAVGADVLAEAQLLLVARSEQHDDGELTDALPEMLRVASPDTIDEVLQSYTQALRVEPTRRLPAAVPADEQASYFALKKDGPYWDAIREEESIALFVPADFQEVELDLLAVA
jgi:type VI secretion system protein ImpJ